MKLFFAFFSLLSILFAAQVSLAATIGGTADGPCASDISRFKILAANTLSNMPVDKVVNGFITEEIRVAVGPELLTDVYVTVSDAKDAARLSLSGRTEVRFSNETEIRNIEATALCSPSTGKYELLSYGFSR